GEPTRFRGYIVMHQLLFLLAQQSCEKPPPGPFGDSSILLLMVGLFAAFYFIILLPMKRREKKEGDNLFTKLKKNDEVLTSSGLIGIVAMVKDDEVVLKVDESSNTRLRVLKSSIVQIRNLKEPAKDASGKAGQDAPASDNAKAGSPPAGK